jgi:hypothetical protein
LPCNNEYLKTNTISWCIGNNVTPHASISGNCILLTWNTPTGIYDFKVINVAETCTSDNLCDIKLGGTEFLIVNSNTLRIPLNSYPIGYEYAFLITYSAKSSQGLCGEYRNVDAYLYSPWTNKITITTPNCVNPTNVSPNEITQNSAKITWSDAGCNSSYIVSYKKSSDANWTTQNGITNMEYIIQGLSAETSYDVRVKADCGSIAPDIPASVQFTTASSGSCLPPTGITIGSITSTGATVSWTAATNAQSYDVEYQITGATTWNSISSTTTPVNLTGLTPDKNYRVRISTKCTGGTTSSNSSTIQFTTSAPKPCELPTNVSAYAFSTQRAQITWDAPLNNTNINSYKIEYKEDVATTWNTLTSNTTTINLTGLTKNTTYNVRISANCTDGATSTTTTEIVTFTTLTSGCEGYIPYIYVGSVNSTYAQISWDDVSTSGNYRVKYRKHHSRSDISQEPEIVAVSSTSLTNYTFDRNINTDLVPNIPYDVCAIPLCDDGSEHTSIAGWNCTTIFFDNGCHAPYDLVASGITSKSASLACSYFGNRQTVKIEYKKSNDQNWTLIYSASLYYEAARKELTGLSPNTSYEVRATTLCSSTSNSVTTTFVTRDDCGPPTNIKISDITTSAAKISFTKSPNLFTGYTYLQYKLPSDANWTDFPDRIYSESIVLTGLESSTTYLIRIFSLCVWDYDNSSLFSLENSVPSIETTFTTNCQAISNFTLSTSQSQIFVFWSAISGSTDYTVQYRRQSDVSWTSKPNTTATSLTLTGLENSTNYVIRIIVNCINGSTSLSNEQIIKTPASTNNDECTGGIDIPLCSNTPLTGSTVGKTLSSNRPSINFGSYPDVWYKFVATTRIHRITTYHSSTDGASQQLIVGVLGDCNNPQSSVLNYIYANFYVSRTSSFDIYGLVPGNTYYVYVAGNNIDFTICTEAKTETPIPSNDAQSGAIVLSTAAIGSSCGASISGSTVGATNLYNQYGGVGKPDVWYKYTAVSSRHKYKLTNIKSLTGTNYGDFGITILPNGSGHNYAYNYIPFNTTRTFYNSTNQTVGQDYYVQIGGSGMGFDLCTEAIAWTPAAPNDDANNATNLSDVSNCVNGTTFGSNDGNVWYKFVATQITHTLTINNTKDQDGVAQTNLLGTLYKGNSLQQALNLSMSNYTYPYTGNFTQTLNNLTVGETYYISICGGCGGISTTLYLTYNICVDIPTLSIWNGTTNTCQTTVSTSLTPNTWNNISDNNGLIAQINPNAQSLSLTSAGIYVNQGTVRTNVSSSAYLDRNYTFNLVSQPTAPVSVRLFFKKADFDALKAADPSIASTSNLRITRVSGGTTNCTNSFTVSNGQTSTVLTGAVTPYGSDYFIEFTTSSFSNFFIHGVNTVIFVELLNFKAQNTEGGNLLTWQTASEVNTSHYDIEHSTDGKSFEKIGETKAQGKAATYTYTDRHPLSIPSTRDYYRLKINDLDGSYKYSEIISLNIRSQKLNVKVFPNPTRGNLNIDLGETGNAKIRILNIFGQEVLHKIGQSGQTSIDISNLPNGVYFAEISVKGVSVREKVIKN